MELKELKFLLKKVRPFDNFSTADLNSLAKSSFTKEIETGEKLVDFNKIPEFIPLLLKGSLRLLALDEFNNPITLEKVNEPKLIGWSTIFRGKSDISIISSSKSEILLIPTKFFTSKLQTTSLKDFISKSPIDEIYSIIKSKQKLINFNKNAFFDWYKISNFDVIQITKNENLESKKWIVSSSNLLNYKFGEIYNSNEEIKLNGLLPLRLVKFFEVPPKIFYEKEIKDFNKDKKTNLNSQKDFDDDYLLKKELAEREALNDLYGKNNFIDTYPHVKGKGNIGELFAVLKMLARFFDLPFRKDTILRLLEQQNNAGMLDNLGLIQISALFDLQGLSTTKLSLNVQNIQRIPCPSIFLYENKAHIIWNIDKDGVLISEPSKSQEKLTFKDFKAFFKNESFELLSIQSTKNSPKIRFNLRWFIPYIIKYRKTLIQVFLASFFVQLFQLFNPLLIQQIIDAVVSQGNVNSLNIYGTLLITFAIGEASLGFLRTYLFSDTTNRIDFSLGSQIINHLFKLPLSYFSNRPTGEISNRINELSKIRNFLTSRALTLILDALFCFIYISVMLMYSVKLTLWAFVVLPIFILITVLISPLMKQQLREQAIASSKVQSHLVETLGNMETVKGQSMELFSRWRWQQFYGQQMNSGFKNVITNGVATSLSTFFQQLSSLFVLLAGIKFVLQGELTLGQLIAFRIIAGYVTQPLLRLATLWQSFQETFISLERIADIINNPKEIEIYGEGLPPIEEIKGDIEFRNVSFKFHEKFPYTLRNINLKIKENNFIGIVGASGSGKSTLFKLLTKTYEVSEGTIYIDGYDISKVDMYSLREQIGYVPQESVLFEGSILENISITAPNTSFEQVEKAAKIACAHDFIQDLPSGYNTPVGEKGQNLSGGQRQRIAIARTILRNPKLIIFDESTSALDPDTEKSLIRNIKKYSKNMTFIFITHRLNSITSASEIIVIDKGAISEIGNHQNLIEKAGRYATLFSQQNSQV